MSKRALPQALAALLFALVAVPSAHAGSSHRGRRSAATITASFADSCRDFATHSSKDISHVVFHYADGRVVEDERICGHDYAIDYQAGEIDRSDWQQALHNQQGSPDESPCAGGSPD